MPSTYELQWHINIQILKMPESSRANRSGMLMTNGTVLKGVWLQPDGSVLKAEPGPQDGSHGMKVRNGQRGRSAPGGITTQ